MKSYRIEVYAREHSDIWNGHVETIRWKAENIANLRRRLVAEQNHVGFSFVVFEIPANKSTMEILKMPIGKGYKGTYNVKTIDGKKVPTWNVDQGNGWDYKRNVINLDGSLGRRL